MFSFLFSNILSERLKKKNNNLKKIADHNLKTVINSVNLLNYQWKKKFVLIVSCMTRSSNSLLSPEEEKLIEDYGKTIPVVRPPGGNAWLSIVTLINFHVISHDLRTNFFFSKNLLTNYHRLYSRRLKHVTNLIYQKFSSVKKELPTNRSFKSFVNDFFIALLLDFAYCI